jgi:hypothetical protein
MPHHEKNKRFLQTTFFRTHKSSMAVGSGSSESDASDPHHETPTFFFADRETDILYDCDDDTTMEKESAEEEKIRLVEAEKERLAKQSKLEKEVQLAEEQRELELREWRDKTVESVETFLVSRTRGTCVLKDACLFARFRLFRSNYGNPCHLTFRPIAAYGNTFRLPYFSTSTQKPLSEIQDGVPAERIKGAAIAATALTFLASKGVVASGAIGLSAAYVSISKGVAGDFLRTVGKITWDATETASKLADQLGVIPTFGEVDKTVVNKYKQRKPNLVGPDVDEGELAFIEAQDDEDLARVLKEADSVISEADAAIAKAEADQEEKVKQSINEELKKIAEEAEITEEKRIAEGEISDTDTKSEDEEEEKSGNAADDEILFDDDQFLAAVELAQEGIEGKIVGVDDIIPDNSAKAEWDAAGELANELRQEIDGSAEAIGVVDDDDDDDFGDIDFEALGKAAREAVEAFEIDVEKADEAMLDEKQQWADSMIEDDDQEEEDFDFENDEDLFSAENLDEIALAARAAVEASGNGAIDIESPPSEIIAEGIASKDWSSLKVVELRDELKKRGLKTSGRKADLVSLLEKSDLEFNDQKDEDEASMIEDGEEDEIVELEDFDVEELGRQARAAVETFQISTDSFDEEPTEEMLAELESEMALNGKYLEDSKPSIEVSKMTVAQLKEECRNRGLKVGGRKSELVERLQNSTE